MSKRKILWDTVFFNIIVFITLQLSYSQAIYIELVLMNCAIYLNNKIYKQFPTPRYVGSCFHKITNMATILTTRSTR